MTPEERQRINVRAIRVSLAAALRHATPHEADMCRTRASELLQRARDETSVADVLAQIDAAQAELTGETSEQRDGRI